MKKKLGKKHFSTLLKVWVVHSFLKKRKKEKCLSSSQFPLYLGNQLIFPFMFGKWANTLNLLLISQLNLTKNFKKIISCTPQGREKVEDYTVVFLRLHL